MTLAYRAGLYELYTEAIIRIGYNEAVRNRLLNYEDVFLCFMFAYSSIRISFMMARLFRSSELYVTDLTNRRAYLLIGARTREGRVNFL